MPSPNPTTRRHYKGNAKPTTLSAPIVNGSDTSFTITDTTGWPDGSVGNFVVTINAGQSDVEKILCSTRSGSTVNVVTRGFDSTSAAGHAATATVAHTISAFDADEWNAHTNASTGVHGYTGSGVGTSDAQNLTNKTLTSPVFAGTATGSLAGATLTGASLDAASMHGGVSGTSLAADRTAWTTYTPTFGNITGATGSFAYKQIGKTLHLRGWFTGGTVTATGVITATLPASLVSVAGGTQPFAGVQPSGAVYGFYIQGGTTTVTSFSIAVGNAMNGYGFTGTIELS